MKIKSSESVRVYRTSGEGCARVLAIPMSVLGATLMFIGISVLFGGKELIQFVVAGIALLTGALIISVAIPIVSTQKGVTLDRIQGTATEWRKIFGLNKTLAVHKLNEFRSVEISSQRPKRVTIYSIHLTGDHNKLTLCELGLLDGVKETAQEAATFLSIPVTDKITPEEEPQY